MFNRTAYALILILAAMLSAAAQEPNQKGRQRVRTVSIPISIFTKDELKQGQAEEYLQAERLIVRENGSEKQILSIRSYSESPLSVAVLIQEDLTSNFNLQLADVAKFIRGLPEGTRVMVAYVRGGTTQIRQRFTTDRDAAARSLRIVAGSPTFAPRSPYDGILDVLPRFDALPAGRRAILLISDGVDNSPGAAFSPSQSIDLDRAILRAQRKNVAVYSFYSPASSTEDGDARRVLVGQGSLQKLSDETGGRAFFQGSLAPVSFDPFFRQLNVLLGRQFLLSYLSDNMKRGYYKVHVESTNPQVKIEHPAGYYYR